jgi:hypothetical protein
MTTSIRILLAQIATFEQQHRAGLNPGCGALSEFFDTAKQAREDVAAFDHGLTPPSAPSQPTSFVPRAPLAFEPVDEAIQVRVDVPVGRVARALLVALGRKDGDPVTVIGVPRGA